jgi:transposase
MDTIGLDLHKRESQLCILAEDGIHERRIVTSRERFTAVLGNRPGARILIEASTESEWVAQHLESLGHEVVVADPNYAPMYATRSRRVKTDKRDARTLAEALKLGAYRSAHRVSAERRHTRAELAVREALVRTRTRYISLAKALVRHDGLRVAGREPLKVNRRKTQRDRARLLTGHVVHFVSLELASRICNFHFVADSRALRSNSRSRLQAPLRPVRTRASVRRGGLSTES